MDGSSSSSQDGSVVEPVVSCEIGRGFRNTKFSRYSQVQSHKKNDDVANELTVPCLGSWGLEARLILGPFQICFLIV